MTNQLTVTPPRGFDRNGEPLAGAKAYVYLTGTMTAATVTDKNGSPLPWPVMADLDGTFPQMFYAGTSRLKLTITDSADVIQPGFPIDPATLSPIDQVQFASQAEAEAGTSNAVSMSPLRTKQAMATLPFWQEFLSDDKTITSGDILTLPHGLTTSPKLIKYTVVCQSGEGGWSAGDVVRVELNNSDSTTDRVSAVWADSSNIYVRFSSAAAAFIAANKNTGAAVVLTNANWKLRLRAWA